PSPYMFYLATPHGTLIGASPEMLVRVHGRDVSYHPIAGTRRRGRTPEDDARLEHELRASEKEAAEHLMLVDLGRNDVGRCCEVGSVRVTELMEVERYSHVMHLVSSIEGRLARDLGPLDALRACFPAGTVTGAPKIRAMEIIAELEPEVRGAYAGAAQRCSRCRHTDGVGYGGDRDVAGPEDARARRHMRGRGAPARAAPADPRRVPGAPGDRARIRRHRRTGSRGGARQGRLCAPRRPWRPPRPAGSVHRHPISLPRRRPRRSSGSARGHGLDRGRPHHG